MVKFNNINDLGGYYFIRNNIYRLMIIIAVRPIKQLPCGMNPAAWPLPFYFFRSP
jgi:hypothetical protein